MRIFIKATGLELTEPLKTYIEEKIGGLGRLLGHFEVNTIKVQFLTEPLKTYIEEKIGGLGRLLGHFEVNTIKVQFEVARSSRHHRRGEVYRAEANMELPQDILRAEGNDTDVRAAVDAVKDKLKREVEAYLSRHGKDHRRNNSEG